MNKIAKLALKNLFRNKRRTILNLVAVSWCLGIYLIMMAFITGEKNIMYELGIKFLAGHIQIHQQGYDEKSDLMPPVDITLNNSSEIASSLQGIPTVKEIKKRIEFPGFLSNSTNKLGGMINCIEPENEQHEIFMDRLITEGEYAGRPIERGNEVMIGLELAKLLDLKPGMELVVVADNKYKQPNMDMFSITGIFSTGFPLFDETVVFIPLEAGKRFMGYEKDEVNVIHVKLDSIKSVPRAADLVDKATGNKFEVFSWEHFSPEIVAGVQADEVSYNIIIGVLLFLMILGLVNTMSMNVFERYSEIGTMRAIGFEKKEVISVFVFEGIYTGIGGFIIGLIFGSAVNYWTSTVGFKIPQEAMKDAVIPVFDTFLSKPTLRHIVYCFFIGITIPGIGAFIPAYRALRKSIVETLYFIK